VNDTVTGVANNPITINVLSNDSDVNNNLEATSVKIVGTANAGDALVVAGQGTWSVDAITGAISFTPLAGFIGSPTPINYTVKDTDGLESAPATVTVIMNNAPITLNDTVTGVANTPITINVLSNDSDVNNNLEATSVKIVGTANAGDALVVVGQGTWSVDSMTGAISFTPLAGFIGSPTPINYTVKDTDGLESAPATVTITMNNLPITESSTPAITNGSLILLSNPPSSIFSATPLALNKQEIVTNPPLQLATVLNPILDTIPALNFIISLTGSLRDQVVLELETFSFEVPKWSFRHTNSNEQLEFVATRPDGSELPNWLRFNPKLLKFSGIAPKGAYNEQVMVTVMDTHGNEVHSTFTVHVNKERLDYKSTIVDSRLINLSNKVLADNPHKEKYVGKLGLSERIHAEGKLGKLQESRELLDDLKFRI
jgi:CshA-type fibril repeat protein